MKACPPPPPPPLPALPPCRPRPPPPRLAPSANAVVAADGSGQFHSLQDAIAAAPSGRPGRPWIIHVRPGHLPGAPLRPAREALPGPRRRGRGEDRRHVRPPRQRPGHRRQADRDLPHRHGPDRRRRLHRRGPDLRERGRPGGPGAGDPGRRRPGRVPQLPLRRLAGHRAPQPRPAVLRETASSPATSTSSSAAPPRSSIAAPSRPAGRLRHCGVDAGGAAARLRLLPLDPARRVARGEDATSAAPGARSPAPSSWAPTCRRSSGRRAGTTGTGPSARRRPATPSTGRRARERIPAPGSPGRGPSRRRRPRP